MCLLPDQVCLEGHVHTQYLGPDEDQERCELLSRALQQLQHVGEDDHTEGQGHGPVTKLWNLEEIVTLPPRSQAVWGLNFIFVISFLKFAADSNHSHLYSEVAVDT